MGEITCQFCNEEIKQTLIEGIIFEHKCPVCGEYYTYYNEFEPDTSFPKNATASFLIYRHDLKNRFLGTKKQFEIINAEYPNKHFNLITDEEIEAFWPTKFTDKISNILIWFEKHTEVYGTYTIVSQKQLESIFFVERFSNNEKLNPHEVNHSQCQFIMDYLAVQKKYVRFSKSGDNPCYSLTSTGYEQLEKINTHNKNNKKVFVSMAFNDNTEATRAAIKKGIIEAKYDATLIDEIIHNKQIVPEMFRLIRESRLLVMDISEPNYGAYYEAGYAQGLGKEVIITCSEERFYKQYNTKEEKKYEKYLKPHFDIAQKQILLWKDTDDLTKKLSEWIKAIE